MSIKYDAVENFNLSYNFKRIVNRGNWGVMACCRD